jgi:pimeloyl-ACP methyl ester carboxylesterase
MDAVGWADAHVLGVSMGGMVAQHLVIEHPSRVRSLTSVMSTTGARFAGLPTPGALRALLRPRPPTEQGAVEWFINFQQRVVGDAFPYDPVQVEATARKAFSRGANWMPGAAGPQAPGQGACEAPCIPRQRGASGQASRGAWQRRAPARKGPPLETPRGGATRCCCGR